jgi:hypothetical protein
MVSVKDQRLKSKNEQDNSMPESAFRVDLLHCRAIQGLIVYMKPPFVSSTAMILTG